MLLFLRERQPIGEEHLVLELTLKIGFEEIPLILSGNFSG